MAETYVKLVSLLKRNPSMSIEQFQDYYENHHSKLIHLVPRVQRYFRRYFLPVHGSTVPSDDEPQFDAMAELWFNSREDLEFAIGRSASPEIAKILIEDEEKLFDRSKMRIFIVDERY